MQHMYERDLLNYNIKVAILVVIFLLLYGCRVKTKIKGLHYYVNNKKWAFHTQDIFICSN